MKKIFLLLTTLILFSCSGGTEDSGDVSARPQSLSLEQQKQQEIEHMKESLNSGSYSLTKAELDQLKAEGAISDSDYQELIKLAQK